MEAAGQLPSLPPLKPGPDEKCTVTVSYSVNMQHEALVMKSSVLYNTAPVNKAQNILVSCICIQSLYISDSPIATPHIRRCFRRFITLVIHNSRSFNRGLKPTCSQILFLP